MASTPQMTSAADAPKKSLVVRLVKWAVVLIVLVIVLAAVAVINNNVSFHHSARAEFTAQLDHAIDTSTNWIVTHPDVQGNPPLMYMIGDMAEMSGDPRLQQYVQSYLASSRVRIPGQPVSWYWAHWVDPSVPLPALTADMIPGLAWQYRWFSYGTAPDKVELTEEDKANLFSPDKYSWGVRLHLQLIALDIYRHYNGPSPKLDAVLIPVTNGVANDAYWDFRVSDSYPQRTATLLAAGRPELGEETLDRAHSRPAESRRLLGLLLVRVVPRRLRVQPDAGRPCPHHGASRLDAVPAEVSLLGLDQAELSVGNGGWGLGNRESGMGNRGEGTAPDPEFLIPSPKSIVHSP